MRCSLSRRGRPQGRKKILKRLLITAASLVLVVNHERILVSAFQLARQEGRPRGLASSTALEALDYLHYEEGPFRQSQLTSFWGRQPILIRNAFDPAKLHSSGAWPSWDNVCYWATEVEDDNYDHDDGYVEEFPIMSRLVRRETEDLRSFKLELGPFPGSYLREVTSSGDAKFGNWTLLLNDVDRIYKPLAAWMDITFGRGFLPRWRRDDGQISIAKKGGGIGPHVDNYDVFLIQTSGKRQWKIGDYISTEEEIQSLIDGLDVRILDLEHQEDQEPLGTIDMNAGDMLYLPPRLVHWGTALTDDCMTLSVGCRAPSATDLVSKLAEHISYSVSPTAVRRYIDPDLLSAPRDTTSQSAYSITEDVKQKLKVMAADAITEVLEDPVLWDEMVGSILTEPKRPVETYSYFDNEDLDESETPLSKVLSIVSRNGTGALCPTEGVSFATSYCHDGWHHYYRVFADGEKFEMKVWKRLQATEESLLSSIEKGFPITKSLLQKVGASPEVIKILAALLERGYLYYAETEISVPRPVVGSGSELATLEAEDEDGPVTRVLSVLSREGRGALYPLKGVQFSTFRFTDEYSHYYRVLADGETFEMKITNRKPTTEVILLEAIEAGVPLTRELLKRIGMSSEVISILAALLERGLYYFGEDKDPSHTSVEKIAPM